MPDNFGSFYQRLNEFSPKAARAFQNIGETLRNELSFEQFQIWFNLGAVISYSSSANGIRFFNESENIMRKISSYPSMIPLLQTGIKLALAQNNMALEYFRQLPDLVANYSGETIAQWAETGNRIAGEDYLTGSEYFKTGSLILPLLDSSLLEPWGKIGLLLSKEDAQNKTFFTLEYFRTSPEILSQVKAPSFFPQILTIGHSIALQSPKETIGYFKAIPAIFRNLKQEEGVQLIFSLAIELSFQAPVAVIDFLTNATDLLKMMNGNFTSLKKFVETGFQVKHLPDTVKAYFALKSKKSTDMIQELTNTVFLSDILKRLVYFAEMVTGHSVEITSGVIPSSRLENGVGVIILPDKINVYKEKENNFKLFKMMALHEAAHIEFGSYEKISKTTLKKVTSLFPQTERSFVFDQPLWSYFPDPVLAQNLWTIAEESRIDYLLRLEYPGAIKDLQPIFLSQKANRPDLFDLPEKKAILEALFQLSIHEDIVIPLPIANTVSRIFSILKTLWHKESSIQETLQVVSLIYHEFQEEIKMLPPDQKEPNLLSPEENIPNYGTLPQSSFSHHGLMTPDLAFHTESAPIDASLNLMFTDHLQKIENPIDELKFESPEVQNANEGAQKKVTAAEEVFVYHEWDWMNQDYKPQWCRLIEKKIETSSRSFKGMENSSGSILAVRRYFEKLRPENYKKTKKEKEGEEFDFDRLIDVMVDLRAGTTPSENFYIRREKNERKISAAFLVDLSGSTRQMVPGSEKRIIDIEKESLRLMAEALNTIDDEYGVFGFSGQSRNEVEFYTIKDFSEKSGLEFHSKIEALEPLKQNRDGTAIRHLTGKLFQREAKIKLLIIISDGKPLDDDYRDFYALEDTKMALREARLKRVHPFCITVDQFANDYIKKMYQDVNFTFISEIQTLPLKLPQIYKKLTT